MTATLDRTLRHEVRNAIVHSPIGPVAWIGAGPAAAASFAASLHASGDREAARARGRARPEGAQWSATHRASGGDRVKLASAEPFAHAAESCVFLAAVIAPGDFEAATVVGNIDAANPMLRCLRPEAPLRRQADAEVFVTPKGPFIHCNRVNPGATPACHGSAEGASRSVAGLGRRDGPPLASGVMRPCEVKSVMAVGVRTTFGPRLR